MEDEALALTAPTRALPAFAPLRGASGQIGASQARYYSSTFRPAFFAGAPIDVGADSGYVEVLWTELAESIRNGTEQPRTLRRLLRSYGKGRWAIADTYFLEGDFAAGVAEWGRLLPQHLYVNLAPTLGHMPVDPLMVFYWSRNHITPLGIRALDGVMGHLEETLDTFQREHGLSVIERFWQGPLDEHLSDEAVQEIADLAPEELTAAYVRELLADSPEPDESPGVAFAGRTGGEVAAIHWPRPWVSSRSRDFLLFCKCRQLMRSAENAHRQDAGLPRVGEGWVSEMALLRELRTAFPDERIVHQARPSWLAPQSLDIFFPNRMLAVEYQGLQHSQPVEFFGGADAHARQQERDARKRDLCEAVGCTLIEVHPGYAIADVIASLGERLGAGENGSARRSD